MDSYLDIAERVLRAARRPMTANGILNAAYRADIVPDHLHGKTQHKTLQARLSEDILYFKLDGRFFRTKPGYYFLTEFESDPGISDKYKDHFSARRRTRDLFRTPALAFGRDFIERSRSTCFDDWHELVKDASNAGALKYIDPKISQEDFLPVWSFSIVRRDECVLTYRIGRYRDDRDCFANRRTIGFPAMVSYFDQTLFSRHDMGATECGLNAVLIDLDISRNAFENSGRISLPSVSFVLYVVNGEDQPALLFVMEWGCPNWFEPTMRRLSLNDVRWMDATVQPNDIGDFEPWSLATLEVLQQKGLAW